MSPKKLVKFTVKAGEIFRGREIPRAKRKKLGFAVEQRF